ncbi:Equisetin cluster transcription factor eqxF [Cladobotryum mycophilum]|uniref:Equisetin cluster transcription factor eqxF n=1 Tax=Cladobotryum mycophilum TaxID=491253 RepID=A0ABR0S888_9HYPO
MPCNTEPIFSENDIPDLTSYTVIVTGGNSGIGYETVKQLALRNARVYIASRSKERIEDAIQQMVRSVDGAKLDLHFLQLDLQDLKSVKAAPEKFIREEPRLDILINNAGIMTVPYDLTVDGFEKQWQVNYLAPYVLTSILMPLLLSIASLSGTRDRVRVINVSSDAAFFGPKTMLLDNVNMTDTKGMTELWQRYGHSKQASIRHAKELNDRYSSQGVTAYSVHPGIVRSNLQGHDPTVLGTIVRVAMKVAARTTPLEGALNSLFCATSSLALAQGGKFLVPVGKVSSQADDWLNDAKMNAKLWQHSRSSVRNQDGNEHLDARIRHLEQLVRTIVAQRPLDPEVTPTTNSRDTQISYDDTLLATLRQPTGSGTSHSEQPEANAGRMIANSNQTVYVSATHWAAICTEIANIREFVDQGNVADPAHPTEQSHPSGPMLLEGTREVSNLAEVLLDIPSREVSDRLVSRYFNSMEASIVLIHAPTFQEEYKRFWLDQSGTSTEWISVLFGIMFMGTFLYVRSQDELPESFSDPMEMMDTFRSRSTECLIISKYSTIPGTYTMEALLLNIQSEFVRRRDAHVGVWVLSGVAIRLAMRMGYHRDPDNYPQISPFRGEMRRRVWAITLQLDALLSCQLGLPSMIQERQCDIRPPSNLLDEDFNLDSVQLPQPRLQTEITPILYTITKARLLSVFQTIFSQLCLVRVDAYEEIMALDQRLNDECKSIPPRFRMASLEDSITEPAHMLIRRYHLELLFQTGRCILHRHHMTKSYEDSKYRYSRLSCVDAAVTILAHQANIFKEVQVGGMLYREKWFVTSLEQHDFLLAAMIVCLELSSRPQSPTMSLDDNEGDIRPKHSRDELARALQSSHRFWDVFKTSSTEAQQAFNMLSVMLNKLSTNSEGRESSTSTQNTQDTAHQEGKFPCASQSGLASLELADSMTDWYQ